MASIFLDYFRRPCFLAEIRSVLCLLVKSIRLAWKSKRARTKSNRLPSESRIFNESGAAFQGNTCYFTHEDYHVTLGTVFLALYRCSLKRAGLYFCEAPVVRGCGWAFCLSVGLVIVRGGACWSLEGGGVVAVLRVFALLKTLNVFLCKVGLVDSKLRGTTNSGVHNFLSTVASGPFGEIVAKLKVASVVRSSSTAAMVIIDFIGTNLLALMRTVNIVVKTGVKAAIAT